MSPLCDCLVVKKVPSKMVPPSKTSPKTLCQVGTGILKCAPGLIKTPAFTIYKLVWLTPMHTFTPTAKKYPLCLCPICHLCMGKYGCCRVIWAAQQRNTTEKNKINAAKVADWPIIFAFPRHLCRVFFARGPNKQMQAKNCHWLASSSCNAM